MIATLTLEALKSNFLFSSEFNFHVKDIGDVHGKSSVFNDDGYIKLSGENIELGCPGNILLKAANVNQTGPASLDTPPVTFPKGYSGSFTIKDTETGEVKPFTKYKVTSAEGDVFEGISDSSGKTATFYSSTPGNVKIEFPREQKDEGPGHWVTVEHDYHGLKNAAIMSINRLK